MEQPITVDGGGLPAGTLLFRRMRGTEAIGRPFEYRVELLSADDAIALPRLVGQTLAVHLALPGGGARHFHGLVTRFAQVGASQRHAAYQATLRPSLWLLTRRGGCRIFQGKSVPDILRAVLGEYGFPFQASLGSYPAREYVVQYRETDFDFVSRLMEQEGIHYAFTHEASRHTLVLADAAGAYRARAGYEEIPFYPPQQGERRERDHVDLWEPSHALESSAVALRDYDFTRPRADLEVRRAGRGGTSPELERYDYPGGYTQSAEGERYARTRLEELAASQDRIAGAGNARGIGAGVPFKLRGHPRQDQNAEVLVVATELELAMPEYESSKEPSAPVFRCRFTAQPSKTPFRTPSTTPRPVVRGPQTARVVGKAGEEIWTDQYGRVKLEFHWDRASPGDESGSCWVRVAQAWAGGAFGAMHLPRIGEEVVVEFLEGDPDRPLVTGHLYEADHMPPYPLPANQTRSGLKSRSTKGGGTDEANELRFEDRKGDEQLYVQAQKNYDRLVKNDATATVGHDERHEVKNDRRLVVGRDETTDVTRNRTETVGGDESVSVTGARTESVGKDESVAVSGARTVSVAKDETVDVGENRSESVGKDATLTVSGARSVSVSKDLTVTVSGGRNTSVAKDDVLTVDKKLLIQAADQIVLESGNAKLVLKKDGTIQLEGKDITIKGSGKINVNADGDITLKGSNVKQN